MKKVFLTISILTLILTIGNQGYSQRTLPTGVATEPIKPQIPSHIIHDIKGSGEIDESFDCVVDPEDLSTYEQCCVGDNIMPDDLHTPSGLNTIFSEYDNPDNTAFKSLKVGENEYLLCFAGQSEPILSQPPFNVLGSVEINKDKTSKLHIYNMVVNASSSSEFIINSNVKLINVEINGGALNPFSFIGNNILIKESKILTQAVGIKIIGEPDNRINNIQIKNNIIKCTLTSPSVETIGIDIKNAKDVFISENNSKISDFYNGIKYEESSKVQSLNNLFERVINFIVGDKDKVIEWEHVGKVVIDDVSEEGEVDKRAIRLAGLFPLGEEGVCNNNDQVHLYKAEPGAIFKPVGECPVIQLMDEERLCLFKGEGEGPVEEEELDACLASGDCECHYADSCIFDCLGLDLPLYESIGFVVTREDGNTNEFSDIKIIEELKHIREISTGAPTVAAPGDTAGPPGVVAVSPGTEDDVDVATPGSGLSVTRGGCSLSPVANPKNLIPPTVIILAVALILVYHRLKPAKKRIKRRK